MRQVTIPMHEVFAIAGTRALGGAGLGLLLSERLSPTARRAVGWTLLGIGIATTAPLIASVLRHRS